MDDLIVLVADQDANLGFESLLRRAGNLGFRSLSAKVVRHDARDHGVFLRAHDFLRPQLRNYQHALAVCDREGCGREALAREALEQQIEARLRANGWEDRASAIVLDPELEAWVWGDWDALVELAGWAGNAASLREWLVERQFVAHGQLKPGRPKEALARVLRQSSKRASSGLFAAMAAQADIANCQDPAFGKLLTVLQAWFPV